MRRWGAVQKLTNFHKSSINISARVSVFPSTVLQDRLETVCYHSPAGVPFSVLSVLREGVKRDLDIVSSTSLSNLIMAPSIARTASLY